MYNDTNSKSMADKQIRGIMFTALCQFHMLFVLLRRSHSVSADYKSWVELMTSTSDACAREVELDMAQALAS